MQFNPFLGVFHVRQELRAPVVHDFIDDDRRGERDLIGRAGGDVAGYFGGQKFTRDFTGERGAPELVRLRLHSDGINDRRLAGGEKKHSVIVRRAQSSGGFLQNEKPSGREGGRRQDMPLTATRLQNESA